MMTPVHARYLETLRQTQWLSRSGLASHHNDLLARIARHAYETVPAYRERLAALFDQGEIRLDRWNDIPIIDRSELQSKPELYRAERTPEKISDNVEGFTSGTSGTKLTFVQSNLATVAAQCQFERSLEVHGIDRSAHLARIRGVQPVPAPYPGGASATGWNLAQPEARVSFIDIDVPIAEQAEWLARIKPHYLMTYPSTAVALAQQLKSKNPAFRLWGVLTVGECVTAETRAEVREGFGCDIIDSYGATEVGYLAFQCPADGGYHIAHESCRLEVVGDDGKPVPAGALGRVVITSLYNYAMPFIRYAIGDLAIAADGPCRCGRTLPRLTEIVGRVRSVFTFPDGSQRSPTQWRRAFRELVGAGQMQFVQTAPDEIELRYVPTGAQPDPMLVEERGRKAIHPAVRVRAIAVREIPRAASGKMEDCISLVTARPERAPA
jgi:phenylacetate-CoA ligase